MKSEEKRVESSRQEEKRKRKVGWTVGGVVDVLSVCRGVVVLVSQCCKAAMAQSSQYLCRYCTQGGPGEKREKGEFINFSYKVNYNTFYVF